jgi:hypothetical protein
MPNSCAIRKSLSNFISPDWQRTVWHSQCRWCPPKFESDPDVVLIGTAIDPQKVRVNVMLEPGVLKAIDLVTDNRSRFLNQAPQSQTSRTRLGLEFLRIYLSLVAENASSGLRSCW